MSSNYQQLISKLDGFVRKYYKNMLVKGAIYTTALLLSFYLIFALAEHFGRFGPALRTLLFYSYLTATIAVVARFVAIPLMKLYRIGEIISHEEAARIIGTHFVNVQDKLLNILQLKNASESQQHSELIEAAINQKVSELKPVPFATAINISGNRKYLKFAIMPLSCIIIILFAAPSILTDSTKRILKHDEKFEKPAPFTFVIENKNLNAIQQEDFELKVKVEGDEMPEKAYIRMGDAEFLLNKNDISHFSYTFKNIQQNIKFNLTADGFSSKEFELVLEKKPVILSFNIDLNYPDYTGKADEQIENTGDITVPAGTRAKWIFKTKHTDVIKILRQINNRDSVIVLKSDNGTFSYSSTLLKSFAYTISVSNDKVNADSVGYSINVIPDEYPAISVIEQKDSTSAKRLYYMGEVKDDYGFSGLSFNYRYTNRDENAVAGSGKQLSAEMKSVSVPVNKSAVQDKFYYYWDLNTMQINPGDELEYYFEITDNDVINGGKSTRSQRMVFKAPTLTEVAKNTEKNNDQIKNDLEKSINKARKLQKDLKDAQKKMLDKKNLNWEDKKTFENLMEQQKQLQKEVENIKQENQKNINQQNEFSTPDEKLLEKQEELQKLFESLMNDEMKKMFEEMEKLLQQMDKNKMQEAMDKMKLDNKDLEKELDRTLELFKKMELEQKMEQAINQLQELSKKQDDLRKETENNKKQSAEQQQKLEQKQEELNKQFDDLKKDLKNIEEKNNELQDKMNLENTEKKQEDIKEQMQKSSEDLKDKKNQKASKSQKEAAQKMDQLAKQMDQMMQQAQQESNEEDYDALRQILDNLVQLSFEQEDLMKSIKGVNVNNPQYVKQIQQQKKIKDDAKMIEDSLLALSKRNPSISSVVNKEISSINDNMEKAIEYMAERQTAPAAGKQQYVMTSVNNLALILSETLQQMQQQNSQSKQAGMGSCKKPGAKGNPQPNFSNMKKMQQQLADQLKKMKDGMKNPGGQKPGEKGGNMSQELAKMAAQQEALRQQLQKAMQQMESGKESGGSKGNAQMLREIAKKMEETETDIYNKRITQETLKRQQEILTRLLEAEKADKEREQDDKRQSNESKIDNFSNPNQFLEYNKLKQREAELLKTVPPSLTQFYKNKVNEYFNNVNEQSAK